MTETPCGSPHPIHRDTACALPLGHDAHRRNGDAWATDAEAWQELVGERDALKSQITSVTRLMFEWDTCDMAEQSDYHIRVCPACNSVSRLRDALGIT